MKGGEREEGRRIRVAREETLTTATSTSGPGSLQLTDVCCQVAKRGRIGSGVPLVIEWCELAGHRVV